MDVQQLQLAINSLNHYEILMAFALASVLFVLAHYSVQLAKKNTLLQMRLKGLTKEAFSAEYEDTSKEQLKNNIIIKRLETQVKTHQRQLFLMKQSEKEKISSPIDLMDGKNSTLQTAYEKDEIGLDKSSFLSEKLPNNMTVLSMRKRQMINQQQRAQYHYRLKQAKQVMSLSRQGEGSLNASVQSKQQSKQGGLSLEQCQLIKLFNT